MHIQDVCNLIKEEMKDVEGNFKKDLASHIDIVTHIGEHVLMSGGKRMRPLLLLISARLAGYKGARRIPLATVIEFIHTASLLHDDVVDNAALRRGAPCANSIWGNGKSIIVGDYLLSKALQTVVSINNLKILKALSDTMTLMTEGEMLQLSRHSDLTITEREYLNIITNKTAMLFSTACEIPALLTDLPDDKRSALKNYGLELGIAYQLMDDCLDYTSNHEDLGKPVGNDLKEGKLTLPLIKSYRDSTQEERLCIENALGKEGSDSGKEAESFRRVCEIIKNHKGIEYTLTLARERIDKAKKALEVFPPNVEIFALSAVADHVIERTN